MSKTSIHPPGEKIQKALREFVELLEHKPEKKRRELLQEVALRFDLSPLECEFLERNLSEES